MNEKEKYDGIYASPDVYAGYGHSNHGAGALDYVLMLDPKSHVDVGCGHNEFSKSLREAIPGIRSVGVDFSCPSADVLADINTLPFEDGEFDLLTAFDVLEHIQPSDIPHVLYQMWRVSKRFCFSICYRDSFVRWKGETLHPTVRNEAWWIARIREAGVSFVHKEGHYIVGEWSV